jgi:hypothetical protein
MRADLLRKVIIVSSVIMPDLAKTTIPSGKRDCDENRIKNLNDGVNDH